MPPPNQLNIIAQNFLTNIQNAQYMQDPLYELNIFHFRAIYM